MSMRIDAMRRGSMRPKRHPVGRAKREKHKKRDVNSWLNCSARLAGCGERPARVCWLCPRSMWCRT